MNTAKREVSENTRSGNQSTDIKGTEIMFITLTRPCYAFKNRQFSDEKNAMFFLIFAKI